MWEIGIPDRSAAEFYIPDPNPKYINKLFINHPDRLALVNLTVRNKNYLGNRLVFAVMFGEVPTVLLYFQV